MPGIIGKKLGMTSLFDEDRKQIPCTLVEAGPCFVTQVKTEETDGYNAVQIAFDEKREKVTNQPQQGHFKAAGVDPMQRVAEFDFDPSEYNLGDEIGVDIFEEGQFVHVQGKTKGRGFQGVVKRHGFHGVGEATHGQHNRLRAPGSIGAGSTPSRVFKGMKMGGQMGNKTRKVTNLRVLKVIPEQNLLVVSGSVPGHKGSYVKIKY